MTNESFNEEVDPTGDTTPEKANIGDLGDVSHPFDQTNGLVDGLEGKSDGMAEENTSDSSEADVEATRGDREDGDVTPPIPPAPVR